MPEQNRSPVIGQCIQECQDCHAICIETANHSPTTGGPLAQPHHSAILRD